MSAFATPASAIVKAVRSRFGTVSFNRIEGVGPSGVLVEIYQLGERWSIDLNQQLEKGAAYTLQDLQP
jgi:hypothetical protein